MFVAHCAHGYANWHARDVMNEMTSCQQVHRNELQVSLLRLVTSSTIHVILHHSKRLCCLSPAVLAIALLPVRHNPTSVTLSRSHGLLIALGILLNGYEVLSRHQSCFPQVLGNQWAQGTEDDLPCSNTGLQAYMSHDGSGATPPMLLCCTEYCQVVHGGQQLQRAEQLSSLANWDTNGCLLQQGGPGFLAAWGTSL